MAIRTTGLLPPRRLDPRRRARGGAALGAARWGEPGILALRAMHALLDGRPCRARQRLAEGLARHAARPNPADGALLTALASAAAGEDIPTVVAPLHDAGPRFALALATAARVARDGSALAADLDQALVPGLVAAFHPRSWNAA